MSSYDVNTAYEDLLQRVLDNGQYRPDRTGTGTYSVFGESIEYDLADGFPLITTKKVHFKSVVGELLWFLSGSTNKNVLEEKYGVTIWREWDSPDPLFDGDLGAIYSEQWRSATWAKRDEEAITVDQIANLIDRLKNDPFGRRHIVNAWNVGQLDEMALPPCHAMFQLWVGSDGDGKPKDLNLHMYQRSADLFLGVPFNIASYALLLGMIANELNLPARRIKITFGDAHIYSNHLEQVKEQIGRIPYPFPTVVIDRAENIDGYTPDMFHLQDYAHHPKISAPVAV